MSTAVDSRPITSASQTAEGGAGAADVFVIFGTTGDLAKVTTFNSLYRLERRGLLTCPIVGVAVSDWSAEDVRSHARDAIVACEEQIDEAMFDRLAARMSHVSGDFGDAATYERVTHAIGEPQYRGEGPTPYEVLLNAAMIGDSRRFKRQDEVEERWRVMQSLLDSPPPVHAYAKGSWEAEPADDVLGGYGRRHPWVAS